MRFSTIASVAVIGLSSAALAQVAQAPVEQKLGNISDNSMAVAENTISAAPANEAEMPPANTMASPSANSADAAPPPGEPTSATSAPPR